MHGTAHPDRAATTPSAARAPSSSRHAASARDGSGTGAGETTVTVAVEPGAASSSRDSSASVPGSTKPVAQERTVTVRSTPSRERSTVLRAMSGSPVSVTCHAPSRPSTGSSVSVSVTVMAAVIAHAAVSVRPKCGTPGSPTRARPRTRSPGAERHTGW